MERKIPLSLRVRSKESAVLSMIFE